jgi:eukaryotic-like serine/threonine-protein kinase
LTKDRAPVLEFVGLAVLVGLTIVGTVMKLRGPADEPEPEPEPVVALGSSWERSVVPKELDTSEPMPPELGAYRVDELIGQGAMSQVFRATDTRNGKVVALKVPRLSSGDQTNLEAFDREFEVGRSLKHGNLVEMYECGWSHNYFFEAMELVEGNTLEDLLAAGGPLQFQECWHLARQLSAVLYYAHRQGLVHGDIKPANLMVSPKGALKMLDFGIAALPTDVHTGPSGSVLGTPDYMAPEVRQEGKRSALSDQYSAGVVFYQILTGHLPTDGFNELASGPLHRRRHWKKKTPQAWMETVERMLEAEPTKRFRDMGAIYEMLTRDAQQFR